MRRVSCDYKIRKNTLVNNKITTVIRKRTNVQLLLWQGNLRGPMFRQLVIYLSLKRQRTTFIHSFILPRLPESDAMFGQRNFEPII